jgi:hypothetical protein
LQSAELSDSELGYADQDQVQAVVAMLMSQKPDGAALTDAVERCEPEQMTQITASSVLMNTLVAACTESQLARALPHMFSDPMWALYYYVCEKGAEDLSIIQGFIAQATVTQQQHILEWRALGERLESLFGDQDPSMLFGNELTAKITRAPAMAASSAPWFAVWCLRHARGDVELWLEAVATSPETLRLATTDGNTDWTNALADCPRGEELSERSQASLDRIALQFADALPLDALLDAFEIRFDEDLRAIAATDGVALDHDRVCELWATLASLPLHGVNRDIVRWTIAGDQFDADLEARLEPDNGDEDEDMPTPSGSRSGGGRGGDEGPAHWGRFDAVGLAVDAFVEHAGGDDILRQAAMDFLLGGGGDALTRWRAAVKAAEVRGALVANSSQVEIALVRLRDALPDEPALGGTGPGVGGPDLTAPASFAGWTEYFSTVVNRSADPQAKRSPRLPSWLSTAQQTGLVDD